MIQHLHISVDDSIKDILTIFSIKTNKILTFLLKNIFNKNEQNFNIFKKQIKYQIFKFVWKKRSAYVYIKREGRVTFAYVKRGECNLF